MLDSAGAGDPCRAVRFSYGEEIGSDPLASLRGERSIAGRVLECSGRAAGWKTGFSAFLLPFACSQSLCASEGEETGALIAVDCFARCRLLLFRFDALGGSGRCTAQRTIVVVVVEGGEQ